ncbi:hypothetical protein Tco_0815623 [Tanacetum coccineum]
MDGCFRCMDDGFDGGFGGRKRECVDDSDYALFIVRWWLHEVLVCLTVYAYMVEQWQNAEESDLRSWLMAYSLVRLRKSGEGCVGLTEALLVTLSWRQTKDYFG